MVVTALPLLPLLPPTLLPPLLLVPLLLSGPVQLLTDPSELCSSAFVSVLAQTAIG